ncbi:MAG: GGDEF domain-containing protein [Lachnospiraceae bacterium]|nr:GGDEF domain-containing protein [Lachnospiraceae bacterium]
MDRISYNGQIRGWMNRILENRGIDAEETIKHCVLLEQYALSTEDLNLLGFSYYYMAETYYGLNDIEKLFMYMTKALGYLEATSQWELAARAYNLLGITSMNRGNAPFAMEYYLNGLTYSSKNEYYDLQIILTANIASLYMNVGEYVEATRYLEQGYQVIKTHPELPEYYPFLCVIETGLAKCYMMRELLDVAWDHLAIAEQECLPKLEQVDLIYVKALEARLYNAGSNEEGRDEALKVVTEMLENNFALLDYFDEFYELAEMLLETKKEDQFWKIMDILEELTTQAKVVNLQRKLLSLKIKYYKSVGDPSGYLQAAGLFYELSEVIDRENRFMVTTMLRLRHNLDRETQMRREAERENKALQQRSETDALTGLSNRFRLNNAAEELFIDAIEKQKSLAIEILDIDLFKGFNDTYGHQVGDDCLVAVATQIKNLQSYEGVYGFRYGGDEFIIIYEGYTMENVKNLAERLKTTVYDVELKGPNDEEIQRVTLSQGICWGLPNSSDKVWDYLHQADDELYKVKMNNRNGISVGRYIKKPIVGEEHE